MSETFIVRVSLNYDFALDRITELGSFFAGILDKFPEGSNARMTMYRFTFGCYVLDSENAIDCLSAVCDAWEKTFGNINGVYEFLVSKYDPAAENRDTSDEEPSQNEDDGADNENKNESGEYDISEEALRLEASKLIRSVFKDVYGASDYQHLIMDLNETIPVLRDKDAMNILLSRNYLISSDPGSGFTTIISSLGDYLHKMHVYPEEEYDSRRLYTEMKLGKETENGFASPDSVIDYLIADSESRSFNIVGLDISYYLEGRKYLELRNFLSRLDPYQDKYIFVFRIPFLEKRAHDEILNLMSDVLLIRPVKIPPLHDSVLLEHIWNIADKSGYTLDVSTFGIIFEKIHQEKMDGRFYGFKSAEKIGNEVILKKIAHDTMLMSRGIEPDRNTITAMDLEYLIDREKSQATGYKALEELIGMEEIAARIREVIAQVKVAMKNEKLDRPCIHMRFTGAPGTGKTTVARIVGQIMREEGILRKGAFFEYSARELIAEYVGQTAVKTATICRDSYGSVLFIDEAYALYEYDQKSNDYGKEAVTTLISEMENHRDDMLVVMAGYTDEMDTLMKANPGLRSRMPYVIHFPNYSRQQLFEIFMLMVRKHFNYAPELESEVKDYFDNLSDEYLGSKEFANARFVRNLYERTWSKAALKASLSGTTNIILTREDFIAASGEKEFSEKLVMKAKLGF